MEIAAVEPNEIPKDVLKVVLMFKGKGGEPQPLTELPKAVRDAIKRAMGKAIFECESCESLVAVSDDEHVQMIGMGDKKDLDSIYKCVCIAARAAKVKEMAIFGIEKKELAESAAMMISEALVVSTYKFTKVEDGKKDKLQKAYIVIPDASAQKATERGVRIGSIIGRNVNVARELANEAGEEMSPRGFVERVKELTKKMKLRATVLDENTLKSKGMNGILSVGKGSARPPYLMILELNTSYKMKGRKKKSIVFVGKGIVFDSGGVSIKPSQGMEEMKSDKSGACAVVGAMLALAEMGSQSRVLAYIPLAENMPGGMAYKPGDLVKMYSGKVVEIISTDAEGRLLLADSLAFASELKPSIMIDIATLTGACVIALGRHACGVMGNDQRAVNKVLDAAKHAHEKAWQLPLWDEYGEEVKGQFSHLKNTGGRWGGAITAAAFLKEFVGKTPWVHIDIAGMAWHTDPKPTLSAGATGFGVKTLVQYVLDREK